MFAFYMLDAGFVCNKLFQNGKIFVTDVDECQLGTRRCLPNSTCVNTPGSYRCDCPMGYHRDGISGCQGIYIYWVPMCVLFLIISRGFKNENPRIK